MHAATNEVPDVVSNSKNKDSTANDLRREMLRRKYIGVYTLPNFTQVQTLMGNLFQGQKRENYLCNGTILTAMATATMNLARRTMALTTRMVLAMTVMEWTQLELLPSRRKQ